MDIYSWDNSNCLRGWLHRYEIVGDYGTLVKERCSLCKKEITFRVFNGRINNLEYIANHVRQALPRNHKLFNREYPRRKKSYE